MKTLYISICLGFFLIACNNDLKLYEEIEFRGKVYLEDTLQESPLVLAPEAMIYLSDNTTDTSSVDLYLYTVRADKEGVFDHNFQPKDKHEVFLTGKYQGSNGITFQNVYPMSALQKQNSNGEIEIFLSPRYPKGVLKVILKDKEFPIAGSDVYLFVNKNQASTISGAAPQGVIQKVPTNAAGIAVFSGLEKGKYYIVGKSATSSYAQTKLDSVDITDASTANYPRTIQYRKLQYSVPAKLGEIQVSINEAISDQPLAGFYVYLFTSLSQAQTIDFDHTKGYIRMDSTDAKGKVFLKNIDLGTYYVAVTGALGSNPKVTGIHKVIISSAASVSDSYHF